MNEQHKIIDTHFRAAEGNWKTNLGVGGWEGSETAWQRLRTEGEPPRWTGHKGLAAALPCHCAIGVQATKQRKSKKIIHSASVY